MCVATVVLYQQYLYIRLKWPFKFPLFCCKYNKCHNKISYIANS